MKRLLCGWILVIAVSLFFILYRAWPYLSLTILAPSDTGRLAHFFIYNLRSLLQFSEPAWWFPYPENGYPGYYYSIAGVVHLFNPFKLLFFVILKFLSLLGVTIGSYWCFVFYQFVVAPILLGIPIALISNQVFRKFTTTAFVLFIFSGCYFTVVNIWEYYGAEPNILPLWAIFFILRYFQNNTPFDLCASMFFTCLIPMTANYALLFAVIYYFPCFIGCVFFLNRKKMGGLSKHLQNPRVLILTSFFAITAVFGLLATTLPVKLASDFLLRHGEHTSWFALREIGALNLKSLLNTFIPFLPVSSFDGGYLGVLSLLFIFMAPLGTNRMGLVPFIFTFFYTSILIPFGKWSPAFWLYYYLLPPVRAMQHLAYFSGRMGGHLFLIFSVAFGLTKLLQQEKSEYLRTLRLIGVSFLISLGSVYLIYPTYSTDPNHTDYGIHAIWPTLLLITLGHSTVALSVLLFKRQFRKSGITLMTVFVLFDCFYGNAKSLHYVQNSQSHDNDRADIKSAILADLPLTFFQHDTLGAYEGLAHWRDRSPQMFSSLFYLDSYKNFGQRILKLKRFILTDKYTEGALIHGHPSINLDLENGEYSSTNDQDVLPGFQVDLFTYNSLTVTFTSPKNQMFVYRDTYDPFWKVRVNGKDQSILVVNGGALKAVNVPEGQSTVAFHFEPTPVVWCLYGFILSTFSSLVLLLIFRKHLNLSTCKSIDLC